MAENEAQRKRLKFLIEELEKIRGRHTELVSVYVPQGFNLNKVVEQLRNEQGTASNIKSKTVRKNVLSALERTLQHLKLYKQTPEHGLVLFSGNVSEKEGVDDIEIWAIEPPQPVRNRLYWCGQNFILDPLKEMIRETEIYGIILIEAGEAEIGMLSGKKITSLKHLDSLVPNKFAKGGWCVHGDTLMPMADGSVMPVKDIGEKRFFSFDFRNGAAIEAKHNHYFKRRANRCIKLVTAQPRLEIMATPEHKIFVANEYGTNAKYLSDIRKGDRILAVRKISINETGNVQMGPELAQLIGYAMGDGCFEGNRITLYDSDRDVLERYKNIAEGLLGASCSLSRRDSKNYWQLRIYGKHIIDQFRNDFPEIARSFRKDMPQAILVSTQADVAGFLRGLFDAEGYVSSTRRVGITMGRESVMRSLQLLLLRFGIISSVRRTSGESFGISDKYAVNIDDVNSLRKFQMHIGFSGTRKSSALKSAIAGRNAMSRVDQVPIDGRYVRKLASRVRMNSSDFPEAGTMYLRGARQMSREVFRKNVIEKVEFRLKNLKTSPKNPNGLRKLVRMEYGEIAEINGVSKSTVFSNMKNGWNTDKLRSVMESERLRQITECGEILDELNGALNSDAFSAKVSSITPLKSSGFFYDIEVDKHENFIANGIIVHNSANRFARVREGLLNDFMKKVAGVADSQFKEMKDLRGVIIGGGGPNKEQFASGDYLDYRVKSAVMGIVNTSYMGIPGLQEAVDKAEDLMKQAAIVKEKQLLERFFGEFAKDSGLAVYGLREVAQALKAGSVEILLVSESFDWENVSFQCSKCNYKEVQLMRKSDALSLKCNKCGANANVAGEKSVIDDLLKLAESANSSIEYASVDTPKGEQLKELGGIAAILRYRA